jgi:hypothetical protein
VSGVYLAKLTSSTGNASFIFFVVRNDGGTEDLLFQSSVTTYEAYNSWGGTSLYTNATSGSIYPYPHATKVSFDRPFDPAVDINGAGQYLSWEYYFVYWMESQGYNVAYTTDIDTHLNTSPLTNHRGFLSVGHDEYWSQAMRTNVQNAINAGVNVGFFGANTMYWQIRFEPNSAGVANRVEVGYKEFAEDIDAPGPDPQWNVNNSIITSMWRDPLINQPENGIVGVMFESTAAGNYVVSNASNSVYNNTGFSNGSSVPNIVGYEYDKVWNNGFSPAGLTILSASPVTGSGGFSSTANSTIYTAPSGARVFASGTIVWGYGLSNILSTNLANAGIQQMTANILNNFIVGNANVGFSPTNVNFNGTVVGTTSAAIPVSVTNVGTVPLTVSGISLTGTNPGDFFQTNNCPATMAAGATCTVNLTFTPATTGNRSASLSIADNAATTPQTLAITGVGQTTAAPLVTLSPASLTFGFQSVGTTSAAQSVTLTNNGSASLSITSIASTGTNPGDFIPTSTCPTGSSTLAVGGSCTINVKFSPTVSGTRSANITVTDNAAGSPQSISVAGSSLMPTVYFQDGFEAGNFNLWTLGSSDSTGTRTVQSSVVNSGVDAAAFTIASSGQYDYIYTSLPAGAQSQTFTRFYFRLNSAANSTSVAIARNANGGNTWEVDYDGGHQALDFYFWNSSGTVYSIISPAQAIQANTWYSVELQDYQSTTGQAQAWINGVSEGVVNADLSNSTPLARLMLFNSAVGTMYFDDVVVGNVYNGPIQPTASVVTTPSGFNFGNELLGVTSSSQTLTLQNKGTAQLNIQSFTLTGANPSDFTLNTSNCSITEELTLPVGGSCTVTVSFTPAAVGARSANIVITDSDPKSPQTISLAGNGVNPGPAVTISPSTLTYGTQNVGTSSASQAIIVTSNGTVAMTVSGVTITGTNSGDFTQTNNCPSSLAAGSSCTINVTFAPTASGTRSASVSIADSVTGSPQTVALSGTGFVNTIYFSDGFESGGFGQWTLPSSDSTGTRTVQTSVVNSGTYAAAFTIASGQYDYIYTSLPAGPQTQTFTRFYFRITSATTSTTMAIARNASGGNTWEVDYDGGHQAVDFYFWNSSGTVYSILSPNSAIQANTWYCVELQDTQTTTGTGQAWLNGTSVGSVNADLSNANPLARLMLYDTAVGSLYFDDVVVSNVYNGPVKPAPAVGLSPTSLGFGNEPVGVASSAQTITLTNKGNASLTISGFSVTGTNSADFTANTSACPATLAAAASCNISVTFNPSGVGSRTATLSIADNAPNTPQTVALSGSGINPGPAITINPSSLTFATQMTGTTSTAQQITVTSSGTVAMSVSGVSVTGTNSGDFAQTNNCPASLATGASCTINVTFTPSVSGARSASVSIADSVAGSPQTVALSGNGLTGTTFFSDGFESGNFNLWTLGSSDSTGTRTVQSSVVHSGSDAAAFTITSGQYAYIYTALPSGPQSQTYTRFYFRLTNAANSSMVAAARSATGSNAWEIDYDGNHQALDFYFWNSSGAVYSILAPNSSIAANTWYSVEIQDTQTTTGQGQAWINGVSVGSVSADLSNANPLQNIMLFDSAVGTFYFDDVAVSNIFQ